VSRGSVFDLREARTVPVLNLPPFQGKKGTYDQVGMICAAGKGMRLLKKQATDYNFITCEILGASFQSCRSSLEPRTP